LLQAKAKEVGEMRKNLKVLVVTGILLALVAAASWGRQIPDPNLPDTVFIDSIVVLTAGGAVVPIHIVNDEPLGGIELTLRISSPDLKVDSFSFAGSVVSGASLKGWMMSNTNLTVYCMPFSTDPLVAAGRGLFGRIFFSFAPSTSRQLITIDTLTIPLSDLVYATSFSDASSSQFYPKFRKGYVDLKLTNCCLGIRGNVNGDPAEKINVSDITYLIEYLFGIPPGPPPPCPDEGNINADPEGKVNISDLTYLGSYLFGGGPAPRSCP
jgi:hypothetical protein